MSFEPRFRSKSPTAKPQRLLSPGFPPGSSAKAVTAPHSIGASLVQLREKGAWQATPTAKPRPDCSSPLGPHPSPLNNSASSIRGLRIKLEDCKQKISRIQGVLHGRTGPRKASGDGPSLNKQLPGDRLNLEKIDYKSAKTAVSCSSGSKSVPSSACSEEGEQGGSYKWLVFNGQQEIFRVLRFVNEGCYGKVYLVQHVATNFVCCLKAIAKQGLTAQMKAQIAREIVIQSYLVHPNIVAIYGHCHDEQHVYLLLEACLGGNLFEKVREAQRAEGWGERAVAQAVREVCRALDFMHGNDVIHRDVKPENVLLHEGTAKLCDFGWAVHSPLLRSTRCGTPLYLSPEVLCHDLYGSKVDVWSVGVLTYELLFGRTPFDIRCIEDLGKIVCEDISFEGRAVSAEASAFILRCLSKHPRDRLTVQQALEHDFLLRDGCRFRQTIN